ncbi:amino acid ABC transporter permease [Occultella kanbiaonis]|uniref:amino acid ABC transporter permease n=1 Tax=Occultella kanbiaonis TaxID=2675754 RepID=UPI0013D6FC51|nr:amino acid ABC transporter permease [Occultella kanbiaonis]
MQIILTEYLGTLLRGLGTTAVLTVVAFVASVAGGLVMATFRISPIPPLRVAGAVYVEIFRNVPLVSLLIVVVYGLPEINLNPGFVPGVIIAMTLVGTAFACETFRTGINAIGAGQIEAARSIGLTFGGIVRELILPQATRTVIGPTVTLFIGIMLSSSLATVVGVRDLTGTVSYINNREALGITTFLVAAVLYAAISLGAAAFGARMETRLRVLR